MSKTNPFILNNLKKQVEINTPPKQELIHYYIEDIRVNSHRYTPGERHECGIETCPSFKRTW